MVFAVACGFGSGMAIAIWQIASEPCSDGTLALSASNVPVDGVTRFNADESFVSVQHADEIQQHDHADRNAEQPQYDGSAHFPSPR